MCDCYEHKCALCDKTVPIHIKDFLFPRSEFKVWCKAHAWKADSDAVVFTGGHHDFFVCAMAGPKVGYGGGNHPNGNDEREMSLAEYKQMKRKKWKR